MGCQGNLLLDRLVGTKILLCPYRPSDTELVDGKVIKGLLEMMEDYAEKLRSATTTTTTTTTKTTVEITTISTTTTKQWEERVKGEEGGDGTGMMLYTA